MTSSLPLEKIKLDGGTQSRADINKVVVEEYAQTIRDGTDFPPVTVFFDGKKHWLADGFHRVAAYRLAGAMEIPTAVHQGTRRDAVLFSVGANASHGLRRTNDDKRRAVTTLLSDKEWSAWSDRQIAKQCGVHHEMVGRLREELSGGFRQIERTVKRGDSTFTMDTAKIGKPQPETAPDEEQVTHDRQRQETIDALPADIRAREEAKAERRKSLDPDDAADLASVKAERDELREANAALEAEVSTLRADVAKFEAMRVLFEEGGFDKVIAAKDEEIRVLQTRVANESRDKAAWKRSADHWKAQAERLGINDSISIDIETGDEVTNG